MLNYYLTEDIVYSLVVTKELLQKYYCRETNDKEYFEDYIVVNNIKYYVRIYESWINIINKDDNKNWPENSIDLTLNETIVFDKIIIKNQKVYYINN